MYSPLKRHGAGPGKKVGIVGIGGLVRFTVRSAIKYVRLVTYIGPLCYTIREGSRCRSVCLLSRQIKERGHPQDGRRPLRGHLIWLRKSSQRKAGFHSLNQGRSRRVSVGRVSFVGPICTSHPPHFISALQERSACTVNSSQSACQTTRFLRLILSRLQPTVVSSELRVLGQSKKQWRCWS